VKPETKNALRVHVGLALAEIICASAFVVELSRALSGNTLSWAYVFEWPVLGTYAVYMWRRLLRDDDGTAESHEAPVEDDPALTAYNEYLDRVHQASERHPTRDNDR
jgi:hypothetical protein